MAQGSMQSRLKGFDMMNNQGDGPEVRNRNKFSEVETATMLSKVKPNDFSLLKSGRSSTPL